jgi:hypothetical protein
MCSITHDEHVYFKQVCTWDAGTLKPGTSVRCRTDDRFEWEDLLLCDRLCVSFAVAVCRRGAQVELSGTIQLPTGQTCDPPVMTLGFVQHGWTPSGLKVTQLLLSRETYKPFKGIRYIAQGGNITIRT